MVPPGDPDLLGRFEPERDPTSAQLPLLATHVSGTPSNVTSPTGTIDTVYDSDDAVSDSVPSVPVSDAASVPAAAPDDAAVPV